jgi:RHS repeat-associated protein
LSQPNVAMLNELQAFEIGDGAPIVYGYDANGNQISRSQGTVAEAFGYDYQNRLAGFIQTVSGTVTENFAYTFAPTGERFSKRDVLANTEEAYMFEGADAVADYSRSGAAFTLSRSYLQLPSIDSKVARVESDGTVLYYMGDALGSVNQMIRQDQTIANSTLTNAWGEDLQFSQAAGDRHGFTQRERDSESGVMHYRARFYDPRIGRFGGKDPILNRTVTAHFLYARCNPTGVRDPLGLYEEDFHFYAVYYLGLAAGLESKDAFNVAYASQYMDDNPESVAPYSLSTSDITLRFHFVSDPNRKGVTEKTRDDVTEANAVVQKYVGNAIATGDAMNVGIEIHALADSFSHAGFKGYWHHSNKRTGSIRPNVGHADSNFGGHGVDLPFNDIDKAVRAAKSIYDRLADFAKVKGKGPRVKFSDIEAKLRDLFKAGRVPEEPYHHERNLRLRVLAWQEFFNEELRFGSKVFQGIKKWSPYDKSRWDKSDRGMRTEFERRIKIMLNKYKRPSWIDQ